MIARSLVLVDHFALRRRVLGMSFPALAARSRISIPTVKRIFGGRLGEASFANVAAIAQALGVSLDLVESDPDEMCRERARVKAKQVARLVQGTSALEGQAVNGRAYKRLVEKSYRELLAGSRRRLWAD